MICGADTRLSAGELSEGDMKIRLAGIDWSFVSKKLSTKGFSDERIQKVMAEYHKFLILFGIVGKSVELSPWGELDKAWHEHVLHTTKYRKDSLHLFDCFLEHNPEIELGSERNLKNTEATRQEYEKYFKEPMPEYVE